MKDEEIVELYWERNEKALVETAAKYGYYCKKSAKNILGSADDADECFNDTLLRAWNSMPPNRPSNLKLYLAKLTRNLAYDRFRAFTAQKRGGMETALILEELNEGISPCDTENEISAKEIGESINRFLRSVSDRDRNVFLQRYFYVESIKLISKRNNMPVGSVSAILSRTRTKLKNHLIKEGLIDE